MQLTCNFQGRLGNNLFQIATVIATARRQGMRPLFQQYECDYYQGIPSFQNYVKAILNKFERWHDSNIFARYEEKSNVYEPLPKFDKDTMLFGYYNSSKYFNDYRHNILQCFFIDVAWAENRVREIRAKYAGKRIISVHVRRTDYVTDYQWDLPLDYYKRAVERFPNCVFLIFSDDLEWCRNNFSFMAEKEFIREHDWLELQLMGQFDGIIIANSTFSVWGAMLGDVEMKKEIVAPAVWNSKGQFNHEIYETHWIKV